MWVYCGVFLLGHFYRLRLNSETAHSEIFILFWIGHLVKHVILKDLCFLTKVSPDGNLPQQAVSAPSRVAAVGPYIQSSTMPRMPSRPELLVKPALPDGSLVMQSAEGPMKMQTLPNMRSGAALQSKGKSGLSPSPFTVSSSLTHVISNRGCFKKCFHITHF